MVISSRSRNETFVARQSIASGPTLLVRSPQSEAHQPALKLVGRIKAPRHDNEQMAVWVVADYLELDARAARDQVDASFFGRGLVPTSMRRGQRVGNLGFALEDVLDLVVVKAPFNFVAGTEVLDPGGRAGLVVEDRDIHSDAAGLDVGRLHRRGIQLENLEFGQNRTFPYHSGGRRRAPDGPRNVTQHFQAARVG
jgi:hypothetical protein